MLYFVNRKNRKDRPEKKEDSSMFRRVTSTAA